MRKNKIILSIVTPAFIIAFLLLLIFVVPTNIPLITNLTEKIIVIGSKWWLLISLVIMTTLFVLFLLTKDEYYEFLFSAIIIFLIFVNALAFCYFIIDKTFVLNTQSKIPFSAIVVLPITLFLFVWGVKIKHIPYKHKLGLNTSSSQKTEFIWKQTHITASYSLMFASMIAFIISIIFSFVRLPIVSVVCLIALIIISIINPIKQAKFMENKYNDMKTRQENLQKK